MSEADQTTERQITSFQEEERQSRRIFEGWSDPNVAARDTMAAMTKTMLGLEAEIQIGFMRHYLNSDSKRGDEYLDRTRKSIVGIIEKLPDRFYLEPPEFQYRMQRWLAAAYVKKLTRKSGKTPQLRNIAWSLLANDTVSVLEERGQKIDKDWLFDTVGPLIRSGDDGQELSRELGKFVNGDSGVITVNKPQSSK